MIQTLDYHNGVDAMIEVLREYPEFSDFLTKCLSVVDSRETVTDYKVQISASMPHGDVAHLEITLVNALNYDEVTAKITFTEVDLDLKLESAITKIVSDYNVTPVDHHVYKFRINVDREDYRNLVSLLRPSGDDKWQCISNPNK